MEQCDMFCSDEHYPNIDEVYRFFNRTISKTKWRVKNSGRGFYIDIDDIMNLYKKQNGKCALTGKTLEFSRGGNFGYGCNPNAATIDRINSAIGYWPDNIQLTRWIANCAKNSTDNGEFINLCHDIAINFPNK